MPLINIDGIGGNLSKNQKRKLVKVLTKSASKITNIPEKSFMVLINETGFENIGSNGELLSDK